MFDLRLSGFGPSQWRSVWVTAVHIGYAYKTIKKTLLLTYFKAN